MMDFPIGELLDDSICLIWLERHLHADGFTCHRCGRTARRLFRAQGHFPAYRCRACNRYDTRLTGTVFEKARQTTGHPGAAAARDGQGRADGPLGARAGAVTETAPYAAAA
jgi:hypothetical protein